MNKTLTLIESAYPTVGTTFEEILQKSIENYVRNIYCFSGQTKKCKIQLVDSYHKKARKGE